MNSCGEEGIGFPPQQQQRQQHHSQPRGKPTRGRIRFASAPHVVMCSNTPADHQPPLFQTPFWQAVGEGGRRMSECGLRLISTYFPAQWRDEILVSVKSLREKYEQDSWKKSWSSLLGSETSSGRDEPNSSYSLRILLIGLFIVFTLILYSVAASIILQLLLPFYAEFLLIHWLLLLLSNLSNDRAQPNSRISPQKLFLGCWWVPVVIETSMLLIRAFMNGGFCSIGGGWTDCLAQCLVPLMTLAAALVYLDYDNPVPLFGNIGSYPSISAEHVWLLAYLGLVYSIRHFAIQGFTLVPSILRPFLGYLAYRLAITACETQIEDSSITRHCNGNVPTDDDNAANASSAPHETPDRSSAGHESSHETPDLSSVFHEGPDSSIPHESPDFSSVPQETPNCILLPPATTKYVNPSKLHLLLDGEFIRLSGVAGHHASRRVSLPAGSLMPVMVQSNISEARGLIADMLAQKDLPPNLVSGLKAVSSLLLPAIQSNGIVPIDLPRVFDTPYIDADGKLVGVETVGQRRASPIVVTWSTTTSATGLPTLEPEPSRARSSNYWKQRRSAENSRSPKSCVTPQHSTELNSTMIQVSDGTLYNLAEMDNDKYLARIQEWPLPIFDMHAETPDTVLTRMSYAIFKRSDLFRIFKISKQRFFAFFHELEQGYWKNPYHNGIHAADVMHATYYLANNRVPAISNGSVLKDHNTQEETSDNDQTTRSAETSDDENTIRRQLEEGPKNGTIASVLSSLELMALYTASAMHDYDHPGRTNAFLVAIQDKKAILYNDRAVLENHHAAASWQLLCQSENNFIEHLDSAEFKRFRYMIIEAILATDLKRHFEILMDFNTKVAAGVDWDNESDKLLTCQICIKLADINAPAKPFSLHKEWTNRIVEEFYAQGDDERRLGLPVSPYMNRHDSQLASLQDSFITHLVAPLAQAMNEAGLLPMVNIDPDDPSAIEAELLINMEHNQEYWKAQLRDKEEESGTVHSTTKDEDNRGMEMKRIDEQDENGNNSN